MAVRDVVATGVPGDQIAALHEFASSLSESELRDALLAMSVSVGRGTNVTVFEEGATLTPADAAKRLGMSRTHLYKLLDRGLLQFHNVGRDRRIYLEDIVAFAVNRDRDRRELAERFAHMDADNKIAVRDLIDEL